MIHDNLIDKINYMRLIVDIIFVYNEIREKIDIHKLKPYCRIRFIH